MQRIWKPGRLVALAAVSAALVTAAVATAKEFKPGDVRVCNADRCVPVTKLAAVEALESFYYTGDQPRVVPRPPLGAAYFELRYPNGYVTGIVASGRLDRFLSYGVILERFRRGQWYRLPPVAAAELRWLTASMTPLRLTRTAVARSR